MPLHFPEGDSMASQPINFPPQLHLDVKTTDGNSEVFCRGRLTAETASDFKQQIRNVISKSKNIVLDLKDVEYMDSTGLGAIVAVYVSARRATCSLRLVNINQRTAELLRLTKLEGVFQGYGEHL
jgi:anti-anti-sigma factor